MSTMNPYTPNPPATQGFKGEGFRALVFMSKAPCRPIDRNNSQCSGHTSPLFSVCWLPSKVLPSYRFRIQGYQVPPIQAFFLDYELARSSGVIDAGQALEV